MNGVSIYQDAGVLWEILLLVKLLACRLWCNWKFKSMPNCVPKTRKRKKKKKSLFPPSVGYVRPLAVSHFH